MLWCKTSFKKGINKALCYLSKKVLVMWYLKVLATKCLWCEKKKATSKDQMKQRWNIKKKESKENSVNLVNLLRLTFFKQKKKRKNTTSFLWGLILVFFFKKRIFTCHSSSFLKKILNFVPVPYRGISSFCLRIFFVSASFCISSFCFRILFVSAFFLYSFLFVFFSFYILFFLSAYGFKKEKKNVVVFFVFFWQQKLIKKIVDF